MPLLSEVLARARKHVAGGWHEPLSLASDGTICDAQAEGIAKYCLHDALIAAAAGDVDAHLAAEAELAQQLPADLPYADRWGHAMTPNTWAAMPGRTHDEVLALFTAAQGHARAEESRR